MLFLFNQVYAAPAASEGPGITGQLVLFGMIFLIFYFLVIRPQSKKAKEHKEMLAELHKGDEVITGSGIYGKIHQKPEEGVEFVTLEIADKTVIKIQKSQVNELVKKPAKKAEKTEKPEDDNSSNSKES